MKLFSLKFKLERTLAKMILSVSRTISVANLAVV
jgi:hypothetical protein